VDKSIPFDDLNQFYVLDFSKGNDIEEILDSIPEDKDKFPAMHSESFMKVFNEYVQKSFAFIINCILYITSENADIIVIDRAQEIRKKLASVKSPGKRKKLERQLERAGNKKHVVGSTIKLPHKHKEAYEHMPTGYAHSKHSYRYWVLGHYRMQAHGKDRALRKIKWIEPYKRGPELADQIHRTYKVE
jgi:hypothetical protein